jgi:FKBP-type peptidyl-prolyl cis-trans isomerase SlyD
MNTVEKDSVVTIRYAIHDMDNQLIDENITGLSYLHGGYDGIFPLVEAALHGKQVGDKVVVSLEPVDAFGEPDEALLRIESVENMPPDLGVGMVLESDDPLTGDTLIFRVIDIEDGQVVLDGNHPLAGLGILFKCEVLAVRPATATELEHGHTHDAEDGHAHDADQDGAYL